MKNINLPVEEFTTPDPITAKESASIDELSQLMQTGGVRHLPILREDKVVGIISDRDLKVVSGLNFKEKSLVRASDIMSPDPVTVNSQATLSEVAFEMSQRKIGSVIVESDGSFYGIFTLTDALNALIEITRES